MNLSKTEQRVLHVLAQGSHIRHQRGPGGKILAVTCYTHDGSPYRLTRPGRLAVRSQPDNRCGSDRVPG